MSKYSSCPSYHVPSSLCWWTRPTSKPTLSSVLKPLAWNVHLNAVQGIFGRVSGSSLDFQRITSRLTCCRRQRRHSEQDESGCRLRGSCCTKVRPCLHTSWRSLNH